MTAELSIVDRIYEASLFPERWAEVCELLSAEANGYAASVITVGANQTFNWITSPHMREQMERFSQSPLRFQNIRPQRHAQLAPFSFMRDVDLMSAEEVRDDPIYNEFLRPLGLGWTMGDAIQEPSGHVIIFDIIRQADRGPFQQEHVARLNALRPDLARAALMSSRLAFRQAQTMAQTLSALGLPSAVIGDGGDVIAMNSEMEAMAPTIRTGAKNRLSLMPAAANALLQTSLQQLLQEQVVSLQSIPVAASPDRPALILHLLPVKRHARDIFSRSAAILIATAVGDAAPPDLRMITGLFDLTSTESRIAREIAIGTAVEDIAIKFTISRETVRSHLKRIFSKTGTAKQSQLAILLSGLGSTRS